MAMEDLDDRLDHRARGRRPRRARLAPRPSRHSLDRWSERVEDDLSRLSAAALRQFLATGRRRPRPRHWTKTTAESGTTFVYCASWPGVCVVVRGDVAVTVLTRQLCRRRSW